MQQKPGRRLSSKEGTPRLSSSTARKRSRKSATYLDSIPVDESHFSGADAENCVDEPLLAVEHSPDDWLHSFDVPPALGAATSMSFAPLSSATDTSPERDDCKLSITASYESTIDPTEAHIEQLAKLVIAIGRSASALSGPTKTALCASSPSFNDICVSTSFLIKFLTQVSRNRERESELDVTMLEFDSGVTPGFKYLPTCVAERSSSNAYLNPGVLMMILACYQRLLDAFETICLAMQQQLQDMQMEIFMGFDEPGHLAMFPGAQQMRSNSPPSLPPPSRTLQFTMMIKLTSDLLSRLDRALAPLVGRLDMSTDPESVTNIYHDDILPIFSSSPLSTSVEILTPDDSCDRSSAPFLADIGMESEKNRNDHGEPMSTNNKLTTGAGELLELQRGRLRTLMKVVKRLVKSQGV